MILQPVNNTVRLLCMSWHGWLTSWQADAKKIKNKRRSDFYSRMSLKIPDVAWKLQAEKGSLFSTIRSFFLFLSVSLCASITSHICLFHPLWLPLWHTNQSPNQIKRLESPTSSPSPFPSLSSSSPIIATFKDRTLTQRALYTLSFFHSFFFSPSKTTLYLMRVDLETHMFVLFYFALWNRECVFRGRTKKK